MTVADDAKAAPANTTKAAPAPAPAPVANVQAICQMPMSLQASAVSQGIQVRMLAADEFPRALRINNKAREDVEILDAKKHAHNRGEWYTMANDATDAFGAPQFMCPLLHVTPYMNVNDPNGEWYLVEPGKQSKWTRDDAQMVIVQYDGGKRDAVLASPRSKVEFAGPEPLVIMPSEEPTKILVHNQTDVPIDVQVSNYSGNSKEWYTIQPGQMDKWTRGTKHLEAVLVRCSGRVVGTYVQVGTNIAVRNLDRGLTVPTIETILNAADAGSVQFQNTTDKDVSVFITKLAGNKGDDAWVSVPAGATKQWQRTGTEVLVVRYADGSKIGVAVGLGMKVVLHPLRTPAPPKLRKLRGGWQSQAPSCSSSAPPTYTSVYRPGCGYWPSYIPCGGSSSTSSSSSSSRPPAPPYDPCRPMGRWPYC
ncbi:hypothetical protein GGF31_007134 [Allomyces arbusculus]|nr:hypothetical protein GGF31_007134 [Allomyces arbusculus]